MSDPLTGPTLWLTEGATIGGGTAANLPSGDIGGLHLQMQAAKNQATGSGWGAIKIFSNDPFVNGQETYLQGTVGLVTSATAGLRRLQIACIEQGTAYRNVTICEGGGNVGIGTATPSGPLHVVGGYDALTVSGNSDNSVGLRLQNEHTGSNKWNLSVSGGGPAANGSFVIWDDTAQSCALTIAKTTHALTLTGTITTPAPSGAAVAAWKLGGIVNGKIRVEIDGQNYDLSPT